MDLFSLQMVRVTERNLERRLLEVHKTLWEEPTKQSSAGTLRKTSVMLLLDISDWFPGAACVTIKDEHQHLWGKERGSSLELRSPASGPSAPAVHVAWNNLFNFSESGFSLVS